MLRSIAFLILRNSYGPRPAPLFAVLWARGYLSQGRINPFRRRG